MTDGFGFYQFSGLEGDSTYYVKVDVDDRNEPYFYRPHKNMRSDIAPTLASQVRIRSSDVVDVDFTKHHVPEAASGFIRPMRAYDPNFFGYTFANLGCYAGGDVYHPGLDYNSSRPGSETNPPVYAVADGVVVDVRRNSCSKESSSCWGGVVVRHWYRGRAYYSQYGHIETDLNQNLDDGVQSVQVGQTVRRNQTVVGFEDEYFSIGAVHLHLEIRNGQHSQPYNRNYWDRNVIGAERDANRKNVLRWYEPPESFIESSRAYSAPPKMVVDDGDRDFFLWSPNDEFNEEPIPCAIFGRSFGGHMLYLYTRREPATSCGRWDFEIPENGRYDIYAYIPELHHSSQRATYSFTGASGQFELVLDQSRFQQEWAWLGESTRRLRKGRLKISLCNATGESSKQLAFDAIQVVARRGVDTIRLSYFYSFGDISGSTSVRLGDTFTIWDEPGGCGPIFRDTAQCQTDFEGRVRAFNHDCLSGEGPGTYGPWVGEGCSEAEEFGYLVRCCVIQ